ncbi:MAG: Homoserine dehydrogenase (EC [uncultured Campylobacterales bacterium]|uniref:Homoserine dehydrogenase n=1 Tax=uncultured Campylobacterales bacterium TaxID=352960 RepID=A0A6S6SQS7_9BACT|nr:MAG: Homoserine dehydrogenase (EC [uncultured Campylobacterales bacterium]
MLKVGIIGVGTVGSSVVKILQNSKDLITSKVNQEIVPVLGVVKNLSKKRDIDITLSDNIDDILNNDDIDIVVELMGGVEDAYEVVKRALLKGKYVVTANKALLAYHRYDLESISNKHLGYEASVAGGIPIVKALKEGLSANNISSIKGIMNGTSNFMLTKMIKEGFKYDEILKIAQDLGYAEADPTFDVGGHDAAHKILILASIAYNIDAKPEEILIEGIENITKDEIKFAKEFGYEIKLLGICKKIGSEIDIRVHPVFISCDDMISKVNGVMNAITVKGDMVEESMYYGPGAGGDATASAVVADIIDIARGHNDSLLGYTDNKSTYTLMSSDDIHTEYYVRIHVADEIGVLNQITKIFASKNISISTFLQNSDEKTATLLFSTHKAKEKNIKSALVEIEKLSFVKEKPSMMRIEK